MAGACLLLATAGCGASPPMRVETALANLVKHHLTVGDAGRLNPLQATPALIERGRQDFSHYCVVCHGPTSVSRAPSALAEPGWVAERVAWADQP